MLLSAKAINICIAQTVTYIVYHLLLNKLLDILNSLAFESIHKHYLKRVVIAEIRISTGSLRI